MSNVRRDGRADVKTIPRMTCTPRTPGRLMVLVALAVAGAAAPASAEIVYLSSGRSLSVKSHRIEGDQIVLELRPDGEIVCASTLVTRIDPDEVPFPEPEAVAPVEVVSRVEAPRFGELIERAAARHGVDPALVRALVQVESAYEPAARSPRGAMGLMQLMPGTARQYQLGNPYDPGANLDAGVRHLRSLLDRFELSLALAAYNAGEGAVRRFGGIPPYPETRDYVARILRLLPTGRRGPV